LQRIYGTAFFTQKELDEYLKQVEEAKKRDHRKLGKQLDLFSIQELAGPGLIFFHPKGGIIRKQLEDWMRDEYLARGYSLVYTPHVARESLWKTPATRELRGTCSRAWNWTTPNTSSSR
jgi:threonyl-tRNA synthetase